MGRRSAKEGHHGSVSDKKIRILALSTTEIFEQYAADHGWIKKNATATANIRRASYKALATCAEI